MTEPSHRSALLRALENVRTSSLRSDRRSPGSLGNSRARTRGVTSGDIAEQGSIKAPRSRRRPTPHFHRVYAEMGNEPKTRRYFV